MKKWMLFGSLLVSVFLCACGKSSDTAQEKLAGIVTTDATENSKPTETPVSTVTPFPTEAPVSTVTTLPMETPALTPTPLPQYQPFFGDFSGYVYYYEDERNKDWEQDVVYIAKMFLTNHPVFQIASHMNMPGLEKSNNAKDAVTAYNEEKKEEFLKEINELVLNIKDLTDTEILYEMSRIVALLEDLHSSVYVPYGKDFPIGLEALWEEGTYKWYVVGALENQEHILGSSLESINGISIEEIVERLGSYVSQECTEGAIALLSAMLRYEYPLKIIGILENEDTNAEFCFVTENGERITLVLELMDTIPEGMNVVSLKTEWFLRETNIDKNYWYTYLEENNMLYVRVNRFYEDANAPALEFQQQLMEEIKDAPENTRLVMDFRNNSGGYLYLFDFEKIVQEVNQREDIKTFLLINEKSYSAASAVPWAFHNKINNAKLVGAPAGQAPTNFGNPKEYKMPNSKNIVVIARAYWEITTDYAYETLIPDITIYQTLEDYKQGIDTVLEAVKEMK